MHQIFTQPMHMVIAMKSCGESDFTTGYMLLLKGGGIGAAGAAMAAPLFSSNMGHAL